MTTAAPTRPALRYFGGKWQLAPWITGHFPAHTTYVEPYGGGASCLLRKEPSFIEVYNDLSSLVVNFFRVLRQDPAGLIAAIDLTPYSREEFLLAQDPTDDPLELARRFYILSGQGRGRPGRVDPGGWRYMSRKTRSQTPVHDWNNHQHLWSIVQRLKQVHIENDDALTVIARYDGPETLHYVDPPYPKSTRNVRWSGDAYMCEMAEGDHRELAAVLHRCVGSVVISGYACDLYDNELYPDWQRIERAAHADGGKRRTEVLWLSPNAMRPTLFSTHNNALPPQEL